MSKKKSRPAIPKKRLTLCKGILAKIALGFPTPDKSKEEPCSEIFCNFFLILRHINLDGLNKISVSK